VAIGSISCHSLGFSRSNLGQKRQTLLTFRNSPQKRRERKLGNQTSKISASPRLCGEFLKLPRYFLCPLLPRF
jgi:hypothetical protein